MLEIFEKARKNKYAIGAFNAGNAEQVKAIVLAAQKAQSPVIIATSQGESDFVGKRQMAKLIEAWRFETGLPLILHFDHAKSFEVVQSAVEAGYDSVHFDGSSLKFEENIIATKQVVEFAKDKGVLNVEGELGYLRGKSIVQETVQVREEDLTDPSQIAEFIEETGVDSLAVAVGNVHGILIKNKESLFRDRLKEIAAEIGDKVFLVLHGGSGITNEDIRGAIDLGVVKININTEIRLAYTQVLRKFLENYPDEVVPYKIMLPVVDAVEKVVENKIDLFGSKGKL